MKKVRIIIIIVFIGFFVLISGTSLIIKDREFSPNENRYLAETPELSWDNILSGKFQDGLEDYLRDQVCFRDGWITVEDVRVNSESYGLLVSTQLQDKTTSHILS